MIKKPKKKDVEEETKSEEQEDAEFLLSATRAPRQGAYESFLTQSLAQVIFMTDDLKRTRAVTVAALMVLEPEREKLAIDYDRVTVLNLVASAMLGPSIRKPTPGVEVISVPWGFPQTEENYKTFIQPWFNSTGVNCWTDLITKHCETWQVWRCEGCNAELARIKLPLPAGYSKNIPLECPKCNRETRLSTGTIWTQKSQVRKIISDPFWSLFFEICQYLTPDGFNHLRNNFTGWATPQIQLFLSELTRIVDPNLYAEMLGLYRGRGKQNLADKVKEATEGPKSDSPLG